VNFLSVDEALSLLKVLHDPMTRALVLLLYGAGLRVSEACLLKRKNLVESGRALRILGKGGHERLVALPESAWRALMALPSQGEYVLSGDKPLHPRAAYELVRQAGLEAGLLRPLHPHALRHSFATHMLSSGADLRVLQELLGHRSLAATQKYTHLSIDQLARTLEKHHPLSGSGASKLKKRVDVVENIVVHCAASGSRWISPTTISAARRREDSINAVRCQTGRQF
jgi:integrase/recombinase XerC/integrase/recombinase XerD